MAERIHRKRLAASGLAAAVFVAGALPVRAADGAAPTYDEAYYATLDYYGSLTEGSVVKSYLLNGATGLTDYGAYDSLINLTDATAPVTVANKTTFTFPSGSAPTHFYFQAYTAEPYEKLPWDLSLSYRLNGVPAKAEELAGATGVVEITVDAIPNAKADSYAKTNYTLEALALFNQDDILSLEAPGAQVQLIGNLRAVLFLALPGEERHFTIRVGADSFAFDGMTFLMVPATLGQLEQVAELAQRKEDLEDNYRRLSDSLDTLLDSVDGVSGSLYDAAAGLDALNAARGTVSAGKGAVYAGADALRADLDTITAALSPVDAELAAATETLSAANGTLGELAGEVSGLRTLLGRLQELLSGAREDSGELSAVTDDLDAAGTRLRLLASSLGDTGSAPVEVQTVDLSAEPGALAEAKELYTVWREHAPMDSNSFGAALLRCGGSASDKAGAEALWAQMVTIDDTVTAQVTSALEQLALQGADISDAALQSQVQAQVIAAVAEAAGQTEETVMTACGMVRAVSAMDTYPADFAGFLTALYAFSPDESLAALIAVVGDNPSTAELLLSGAEIVDTEELSESVNAGVARANAALERVSALGGATADVLSALGELCSDLAGLRGMAESAGDFAALGENGAETLASVLAKADALYGVIDAYEPELLQGIETTRGLISSLTGATKDMDAFSGALENLMQSAGSQFDTATMQSLGALSASLRGVAGSLDATEGLREAKENFSSIIEDTWNEHTGELDTLLLIDATADPVSLTDPRNAAPESVQIMLRTQEIKGDTSAAGETATETPGGADTEPETFWDRLGQMFRGILNAIVGLFHREGADSDVG